VHPRGKSWQLRFATPVGQVKVRVPVTLDVAAEITRLP
jgi:hypothetical protein